MVFVASAFSGFGIQQQSMLTNIRDKDSAWSGKEPGFSPVALLEINFRMLRAYTVHFLSVLMFAVASSWKQSREGMTANISEHLLRADACVILFHSPVMFEVEEVNCGFVFQVSGGNWGTEQFSNFS